MSVRPHAPPLTEEDYYRLPEGNLYQLIEGDLYMAPAPDLYHQSILKNLGFILHSYLEQDPIGILFLAPADVYFSRTSIWQPDLFVALNAKRNILKTRRCEGAPDFIAEILSPSSQDLDLNTKRAVYAREGVTEYWALDPEASEVLVYRFGENPNEPGDRVHSPHQATSPLFPGLAVDLDAVFRPVSS
ncbi:MAG: Uma2 family endonuclease [Verrucomicrobia bacterium]|nr:Uma2 family endonuclease [Verrucomicrobiota bacterium]MBV8484034.1 Uma2 family endonuclease [Verrucomicrobiota bacterium]